MIREIAIRKELNGLYRSFQSEMRALPFPLRELAPRSRKGFVEDNVMLCLPFWLLDVLDVPDDLETARAMALANYYGTAYCLAQDRALDADGFGSSDALIIANIYFSRWIGAYRRYFDSASVFWSFFEKYLAEYSNSLYWEKKEHVGTMRSFAEDDLAYLGHKFSPTKICCAAMSILSRRERHIDDLSRVLDCYHIGFQLRDDYIDWKKDLKARNYTYFLCAASGCGERRGTKEHPTVDDIEEAIDETNVAEDVLAKSSRYFLLAKETSDRLGCTHLSDHLTRMVGKNDADRSRLFARKAFRASVLTVGAQDARSLFPREMHDFSYGDERFILLVDSLKIYKVDPVSREVISLADGAAARDIFSRLHGTYSEDEIRQTLHELLSANILGFEREQHEDPPGADDMRIRHLSLNITHDCNLRCVYCYGDGGGYGSPGSSMSKDVARRAVDFLIDHSDEQDDCTVILFGGEPLLDLELVKHVVEYGRAAADMRGRSLRFNAVTNGTLLTDDVVSYFNSNGVGVQISMDGPPRIHNYNRRFRDGAGSYEAVLSGAIKLIQSRPGRVSVRSTVTPNRMNLEETVTHLIGVGFSNVHVEPAAGKESDHIFDPSDYELLKKQYEMFADYFLEKIKAGSAFGFSNFSATMARIHYGKRGHYLCGAGKSFLAVSSDGGLYPCHRFVGDEAYRMGSVFDKHLHGRDQFYQSSVENMTPCSTCWARYFCSGGCAWHANLSNKTISRPDADRCDFVRHVMELSMKIYTQLSEDDKQYLIEMHALEGRPYMAEKK